MEKVPRNTTYPLEPPSVREHVTDMNHYRLRKPASDEWDSDDSDVPYVDEDDVPNGDGDDD